MFFLPRMSPFWASSVGGCHWIMISDSDLAEPDIRIGDLIRFSFPRIVNNEVTFKAALRSELEMQEGRQPDGDDASHRGHRMNLIARALKDVAPSAEKDRLTQSIAVLFGVEALTVLRDICGLDGDAAEEVVTWAAETLTKATLNAT